MLKLRKIIYVGLFGLALLVLSAHEGFSADIKSIPARGNHVLIVITGEIVPGDADAFIAAVKRANSVGKFVANIRLNSEGGNLLEGMKLADEVRFGKISTNVGKNATCASACFLIFAAGATRFANYTAQIGVHGASDQSGEETVASEAATVSMAKVAKELGVPASIIGRMVVTPPTKMVWLTPQDLQSMGTTMVGKPAQVATRAMLNQAPISSPRQTASSGPLNLQPQARARAAPTWRNLVNIAVALSAKENNGTPAYMRSCEPKQKVCHSGILYLGKDNKEILLNVTRDIDDRIVSREICEFNATADIRKCVNWDSGTTHTDMKDDKGDWYQVSN